MSVNESELEEISRKVAEEVIGKGSDCAGDELGGSTKKDSIRFTESSSDSEGEIFGSPTETRRDSFFKELSKKDRRYKDKLQKQKADKTMAEETLKQLIDALQLLGVRNTERQFDVRDVKDIVVAFDPDIPTTPTAEQWIETIDKAAALYKASDEWKLQCGILNLQGASKLWFSGVEVTTWREFKTKLIRDFPTSIDVVSIHQTMMNRKKMSSESLETYFYSHVAMGKKGKLPDEAIIKYIVSGLEGRYGTIAQVGSLPDLLKQLKWLVELKDLKVVENNTRAASSRSPKPTGTLKCYRCGTMGHVAATCSEKCNAKMQNVECFRCNQRGHMAKNCSKFGFKEKARIMQEISQQSNFVKQVKIGDSNLDALYDCGSAVTTIKQNYRHALSNIEQCDLVLIGFGGNKVSVTEKSNELIIIDNLELEAAVYVVPNYVQANAVIIGRDILDREDIRFIKERGSARIERIPSNDDEEEELAAIGGRQDVFNVRAFEPIDATEINVDSEDERGRILEIVRRYRHCFAKNYHEMGTAKDCEMVIEMSGIEKPVYTKQYPMEYSREKVVEETVSELIEANIIQSSKSPYNSPTVLVRKKNGDWRMVVDYRAVNAKTVKDKWPMPVIEDCLNRLVGGCVFIAVDLFRGYHQIPIAENCRKFTAFSTPHGHFEYLKMPFGLSNGSAVFQRMIDSVIAPLRSAGFVAYLDDVTFGGHDIDDVIKKLEIFLGKLSEHGLTANLEKTHFLKTSINFLGHEISEGKIQPGTEKVMAIREFPTPVNVRNVREFLGLANYFRRFVKEFSIISEPLTRLTKKDVNFEWNEQQQRAFQKLKEVLISRPVVMMYDPNKDVELHTDACSHGLSGILLQKMDDGLHAISYFSRKTSDRENRKYSYELEALAIVESVERYRKYLLGRNFTIVTDCEAVKKTMEKKIMLPVVGRWLLKLQEYDYEIVHRKGEKMKHVDCLSRNAVEEAECEEPQPVVAHIMEVTIREDQWLKLLQREDEKLHAIMKTLSAPPKDNRDRQVYKEYALKEEGVMRKCSDGLKWVVPNRARWRIARCYHDDLGHKGVDKVFEAMKQKFWFRRMRSYVKRYIGACIYCAYVKGKVGAKEGLLQPIEKNPVPFDTIHLDHLGPFIRSKLQNEYLIVLVDGFTKYVVIKAVRNTKTGPVIVMLNEVFGIFGKPKRIITDRGTAYTSKEFENFCVQMGIVHVKVAVGTPRANGQVERANRSILDSIRCMVKGDSQNWDQHLRMVQWGLNSMINSTTKLSPNTLLFNYNPRDIIENQLTMMFTSECTEGRSNELKRLVQARIKMEQQKQKKYFDERRKAARKYYEGDLVLVEKDLQATGQSKKLEPRFKGPYVVQKALGNDRYLIVDVPGVQLTQRRTSTVFAAERMKPWSVNSLVENSDDDQMQSDISSEE